MVCLNIRDEQWGVKERERDTSVTYDVSISVGEGETTQKKNNKKK